MGQGFYIIIHLGFRTGLNMCKPYVLEVNGKNWWPYETEEERVLLIEELTRDVRDEFIVVE